jgi:hypothetical protein
LKSFLDLRVRSHSVEHKNNGQLAMGLLTISMI